MPVSGKYQIENIGTEAMPFKSMVTAVAPHLIESGQCVDALNLQQVIKGQWEGRLGSDVFKLTQAFGSFTSVPLEARLITEYYTETGSPGTGYPGIETTGNEYLVVFVNMVSGGAIVVMKQSDYSFVKKWEVTGDGLLDTDGLHTAAVVQETVLIPKARQAHGKVILPLPTNKNISVWIENGSWNAAKVSTKDFDSGNASNVGMGIDIVKIDARQASGQENDASVGVQASLVLAAWTPQRSKAQATDASTWTGSGSGGAIIINRADTSEGVEYVDIAQDPVRDPNGQLTTIQDVKLTYYPRTSPVTGLGYAAASDIFYRPPNQVQNFDALATDTHRKNIPESRWGYELVWKYADGTYSNPSADLWVGDAEFSALQSTDAANLHASFSSGVYAEPVSGLSGSTLASPCLSTDTTITVQSGDHAKFPAIPPPGGSTGSNAIGGFLVIVSDGVNSEVMLCTSAATDALAVTRSSGLGYNYAFAAGATVKAYYAATSKATPASSFLTGSAGTLAALKKQMYPPTYAHYSDDVYITAYNETTDSYGTFLQTELGGIGSGAEFETSNLGRNWQMPTVYATGGLVDANNVLRRYIGFTLDLSAVSGSSAQAGATPTAYPKFAGGDPYIGTYGENAYENNPNVVRVTNKQDDLAQALLTTAGPFDQLILKGYYDWEFFRNVGSAIPDKGLRVKYTDQYGNPQYKDFSAAFSCRKLLPATRILWDWQLSQTFPASALFQCPRIQLKISATDIPANATDLLIFRTLNSLDPAFNATVFGLAQTIPVVQNQDLTFFDNVKDNPTGNAGDQNVDFSVSPQDYAGLRNGLASQFIELKGERVFYANNTESYLPLSPRSSIMNTDDTKPMNTDCRIVAITSTDTNAFPHTAFTLYNGSNGTTATRYLLVYRDINNKTSLPVTVYVKDGRGSSSDAYVINGYFLGHGNDDSIKYLDVYRYDYNSAAGDFYILVSSLQKSDGGVFYDDTKQTTNAVKHYAIGGNFNLTGTLAVTHGSAAVVGTSTLFNTECYAGETLIIAGVKYTVLSVTDNTHLTLSSNYAGTTASGLTVAQQQAFGVWQTIIDSSGVRYSEPLRPEFILGTSLQDVTRGDGEGITGLDIIKDNIIVFKPNSMGRIMIDTNINSPQIERLETISLVEGCIAPCTLQNDNDLLFYLSEKGLRMYDGSRMHQIDKYVYSDIQTVARYSDVTMFTSVWVPHYQQYWLSLNTDTKDIATTNAVQLLNTDTSLVLQTGIGATLPQSPSLVSAFSITDGTHTDYGYLTYNGTDTVTIVRYGSTHTFAIGSTVKIVNSATYVYVFDINDDVVSRFLFPNRKIYLCGRDGEIRSAVTMNPAGAAGATFAPVMEEDGGVAGTTATDGGVDASNAYSFPVNVSWIGKKYIGETSEHVKRLRRSRIRARQNSAASVLLYSAIAVNTGIEPANAVADAVPRYSKVSGGAVDVNLDFIGLDVQRGLDIQPTITCGAQSFILKGLELYFHVKRMNQ